MEKVFFLSHASQTTDEKHTFVIRQQRYTLLPVNINMLMSFMGTDDGIGNTVIANSSKVCKSDCITMHNGMFVAEKQLHYTALKSTDKGGDLNLIRVNALTDYDFQRSYIECMKSIFDHASSDQDDIFRKMIDDGFKGVKSLFSKGLNSFMRDDLNDFINSAFFESNSKLCGMLVMIHAADVKRIDFKGAFYNDKQLSESKVMFVQSLLCNAVNTYLHSLPLCADFSVVSKILSRLSRITSYGISNIIKSELSGDGSDEHLIYISAEAPILTEGSKINDVKPFLWMKYKTELKLAPGGDYVTYEHGGFHYLAVLSSLDNTENHTLKYSNYILNAVKSIDSTYVVLEFKLKQHSNKMNVPIRRFVDGDRDSFALAYTNDVDMVELIRSGTRRMLLTLGRACLLDYDLYMKLEGSYDALVLTHHLLHYDASEINKLTNTIERCMPLLLIAELFCLTGGDVDKLSVDDVEENTFEDFQRLSEYKKYLLSHVEGIESIELSKDSLVRDLTKINSGEILRLLNRKF